jgi:hypothetical protein
MKTVVKFTNLIRGGNKALSHRKFREFLQQTESSYGDLLLHSEVRWLSAGKCLERFFALRSEIPIFLIENVKANTAGLKNLLHDPEFLRVLAFLSDITGHLNDLNLKLQEKEQTVSNLFGYINGFRNKLKIFKVSVEKNDLAHFHACKELAEKLENDNESDFSVFASNIENIKQEFNSRFADFEDMRDSIVLFNNPLGINIEDQPTQFQLELCDLQADPFLQTRVEKGLEFFKFVSFDRFPTLCDFGLKMTSMSGSTYLCESAVSNMTFTKSRYRSSLADGSLQHLHFLLICLIGS